MSVLKTLQIPVLLTSLVLLACQHTKMNEVGTKKPDFRKAASFNVQLGLAYLNQGDRPRAKKKLLTALKQEPNSPDVNAAIAYYFEKTNELKQAQKYYLKAISLSSNAGAQLNNYGAFFCRQGQYRKAETYFLKAVEDEQYIHTAGAYENAGLCAQAIPDLDKAKLYFTKALNHDPSRKVSLYELVRIESKAGHDTEALKIIQKHHDLVIKDRIFLTLAQAVASKARKYDQAAAYENKLKINSYTDNSGVSNHAYNTRNE